MISARWFEVGLLLAGMLAAPQAVAGDGPLPVPALEAGMRERLAACDALSGLLAGPPPTVERVEAAGSAPGTEAVHLTWPKARYLVFLHPEGSLLAGGQTCEAFKVGRALDRANGRFWTLPGKAKSKAFLLTAEDCDGEHCPLAVVVRTLDPAPRLLGALRTDEHCDDGAKLKVLKAFDDLESLEVTCRQSAGAGWNERRILVHAVSGRLTTVLTMNAGTGELLSPEEKRQGQCPARPAGRIEVARRGAAPVLKVLEPRDADVYDDETERLTGQVFDWTWDPARGAFVKASQGTPQVYDPVAGCKRR